MAEKIDGSGNAQINNIKFSQQVSHPSSPASGYEVLYVISGSAHGGLYVKDSSGREIGPFITGSAAGTSELDYVQFTGSVSPTATTEGTANTVVTGNSVTYDGATPVIIEFYAPNMRPASGGQMTIVLYQDGASIGQLAFVNQSGLENIPACHTTRRLTPSAGSHTYSIRAFVNTGTGLVAAGGGGSGNTSPGFIRIVKANP